MTSASLVKHLLIMAFVSYNPSSLGVCGLAPHSVCVVLTPHSSLLTPHSSLLTPHSVCVVILDASFHYKLLLSVYTMF